MGGPKESHQSEQAMCKYFAPEIAQLRDVGLPLTFEGVTTLHRFEFYVMGDAKWV